MGAWHFYRDESGREWGPFSPGQCTALLNRGVLNNQSPMRLDGDAEWLPFGRRKMPKDWFNLKAPFTDEDKRRLDDGDRIALELELHVARGRAVQHGANHPPAFAALLQEVERSTSMVYVGSRWWDKNGPCEMLFSSTGEAKISVFLVPRSEWFPDSPRPGEIPEPILSHIVARKSVEGVAGEARKGDDICGKVRTLDLGSTRWDWLRIEWTGAASAYPGATFDDWFVPVSPVACGPLVYLSFPKYLSAFYHSRVVPFLQALDEAAAKVCQEQGESGEQGIKAPEGAELLPPEISTGALSSVGEDTATADGMPSAENDWFTAEHEPMGSDDVTAVGATWLWKAKENGECVRIRYLGGTSPGAERDVLPKEFFRVDGFVHLYMLAECKLRGEERTFRVDRIEKVDAPPDGILTVDPSSPIDKTPGWEYRLTADRLSDRLHQLLDTYRPESECAGTRATILSLDDTTDFIKKQIDETMRLMERLRVVVDEDLALSWGPPGVPGDEREIVRAVDRCVLLCHHLIDVDRVIRRARPCSELARCFELLKGVPLYYVSQLSRHADSFRELLKHATAGTHRLEWRFDTPPGITAFNQEIGVILRRFEDRRRAMDRREAASIAAEIEAAQHKAGLAGAMLLLQLAGLHALWHWVFTDTPADK